MYDMSTPVRGKVRACMLGASHVRSETVSVGGSDRPAMSSPRSLRQLGCSRALPTTGKTFAMPDDQRFLRVDAHKAGVRSITEARGCPIRGRSDPEVARRLARLLAGIASGNRDDFTEFYRSTQDRVYGLALRLLRRPAAAEEITQEIYLHVWNTAEKYDPQLASPIGWLMMLTHRRAVDRLRTDTSAATRDLAYGHRHLGRDHDIVLETVGQRSEERAVAHCLGALTEIQRETVALAYYGGRTYPEVAKYLGIPLSTVKTRIRDGLERLRNCLTGSVSDA